LSKAGKDRKEQNLPTSKKVKKQEEGPLERKKLEPEGKHYDLKGVGGNGCHGDGEVAVLVKSLRGERW